MIGMAKTQSSGVEPNSPYSVNLTPGSIFVQSTNGGATSAVVYSDVISGVGPFTYLWTITGAGISINNPESANTSFSSGGFNDNFQETATLTVTDTGNADAETSKDMPVRFAFEP